MRVQGLITGDDYNRMVSDLAPRSGPQPSSAGPTSAAKTPAKTTTRAQVQAYADQYHVTYDQALSKAKAEGFELTAGVQ
jgi:hypothetical protein